MLTLSRRSTTWLYLSVVSRDEMIDLLAKGRLNWALSAAADGA